MNLMNIKRKNNMKTQVKVDPPIIDNQLPYLDYPKWANRFGDIYLGRRKPFNQKLFHKYCIAIMDMNNIAWEVNNEKD